MEEKNSSKKTCKFLFMNSKKMKFLPYKTQRNINIDPISNHNVLDRKRFKYWLKKINNNNYIKKQTRNAEYKSYLRNRLQNKQNSLKKRARKALLQAVADNNNYEMNSKISVNSYNEKNDFCKCGSKVPVLTTALRRLEAAKFRMLNEQMNCQSSEENLTMFKSDPNLFYNYHKYYNVQVSQWPINPLDVIIQDLNILKTNLKVADFGCGEAKLQARVKQKVFSIDMIGIHPEVIVCNMNATPLESGSIDIVVLCLSLLGTDLTSVLKEANRVLHKGGILKIAEIASRFVKLKRFVTVMKIIGFKLMKQDNSHPYFIFLEFSKYSVPKTKLPDFVLQPISCNKVRMLHK